MNSFDLTAFRKEITAINKRGADTIRVMEKGGYSPERVEAERTNLQRDILNARVKTSALFQDALSEIIKGA